MKIEPFYCDMHIHTYADANKRESVHYDVDALLARVRACARGSKAMISLTDHNVINTDAYKEASEKAGDDVALILGVELHVKANGPKPYHAHAYFNVEPNDDNIEALNEVLDELYPDKLPSKDDDIPQLPAILNAFQKHEFLLLSSYRVLTVSIEPFRMRCSYWLGRYVGMCPGAYSDPAKETDGLPHSGRFAD